VGTKEPVPLIPIFFFTKCFSFQDDDWPMPAGGNAMEARIVYRYYLKFKKNQINIYAIMEEV
jgi:hypothetical protein